MSVFVRKVKTASGATAVQIVTKQGRQVVGIEHLGSAHTDTDLALLIDIGRYRIRERERDAGQAEFDLGETARATVNAVLLRSHSRLLYDTLAGVYDRLGFTDVVTDPVFRDLVIARVIEPSSKLDTIRILTELGLAAPSNTSIHRSLNRAADRNYRDRLSAACVTFRGVEQLTLVLYDVTTLFFQVEHEDDYRKPGLSKERRLEPQIVIGLLVDERGFPLQVHSFEGNTAETLTLVPVLDAFKAQHPEVTVSVACDAGMLSAANLSAVEAAGYGFIVGSRISKTPYDIADYQNEGGELSDGQIFDTQQWFGKGETRRKRRVVYQYRQKRARLDLRNIDKQVEKTRRVVAGVAPVKKGQFLKVSGARKSIDEALVASARQHAGIKGYVTNLAEVPATTVIDAYHQLFNVEASFRMAKSDLRARPIYHRVREKIEAHLTVVFAAIAVSRHIQEQTGMSIKRFVRALAPIRDAVIELEGNEHHVPAAAAPEITELVAKLGLPGGGHETGQLRFECHRCRPRQRERSSAPRGCKCGRATQPWAAARRDGARERTMPRVPGATGRSNCQRPGDPEKPSVGSSTAETGRHRARVNCRKTGTVATSASASRAKAKKSGVSGASGSTPRYNNTRVILIAGHRCFTCAHLHSVMRSHQDIQRRPPEHDTAHIPRPQTGKPMFF